MSDDQPLPAAQSDSLTDIQKEYAAFLGRDFSECFAQMRHYDEQIVDLCKFAFGAYTTAIGGALALYRYGLDMKIDYTNAASSIVGVAFLLGLVMISLVVRNRVYFVVVTRYVNEHRAFFLSKKPLGFSNTTRMYNRVDMPQFFDWRSSQSFQWYILALLNAVLGGLLAFFSGMKGHPVWITVISAALLAAQLVWAILYLTSREKKSAVQAVFGLPTN
jgi:hypothetical protein